MADLSKIRIPNGTEYNLKDAQARADITALNGSLDTNINNLKTSILRGKVSTNEDFNLVCKELYAPNYDFTGVTWVRVYNGFNNIYGFRFYNSSNQQVTNIVYSQSEWMSNHVAIGSAHMALLGDLSLIGATYKDFRNLTVNNVTKSLYDSQTINNHVKITENYRYEKTKYFSLDADVVNEVVISGTVTTGKRINIDGNEETNSLYSIIAFNVTNDKIYKLTNVSAGTDYSKVITAEIRINDITVSKYYAVNADRTNLYISGVSGTAKICYRNNVAPAIYECDPYVPQYALSVQNCPTKGQILYEADNKVQSGHIVNAISYADGTIIACRSNGKVVKIDYSNTEVELLSLSGSLFDWRLCWMDSDENVYVSPHATRGLMVMADRGLYRLEKGSSSFVKVISLYDISSSVTTETEENNDTIWTMCEDSNGNLYAGVYAHTTRANPAIYKSIDGGLTWTYLYNFETSGLTANGRHIHSIIYSKWQNALYCIIGEVNKIWKSTNGGTTWVDIGITLPYDKGSSMLPLPYGILVGSDGAYNCAIHLIYPDDSTYKTAYVGYANTVFAIRRSDITGFIYAFCKIDGSATTQKYYPPYSVLSLSGAEQEAAIQAWRVSDANPVYTRWLDYYNSVKNSYPDDAIIPTHYAILVSRNGGDSFEILKQFESASSGPDGFWTTGQFINGEVLTGRYTTNNSYMNPIVISEGKHKYVSGGCDLSGEIFAKTNMSPITEIV